MSKSDPKPMDQLKFIRDQLNGPSIGVEEFHDLKHNVTQHNETVSQMKGEHIEATSVLSKYIEPNGLSNSGAKITYNIGADGVSSSIESTTVENDVTSDTMNTEMVIKDVQSLDRTPKKQANEKNIHVADLKMDINIENLPINMKSSSSSDDSENQLYVINLCHFYAPLFVISNALIFNTYFRISSQSYSGFDSQNLQQSEKRLFLSGSKNELCNIPLSNIPEMDKEPTDNIVLNFEKEAYDGGAVKKFKPEDIENDRAMNAVESK